MSGPAEAGRLGLALGAAALALLAAWAVVASAPAGEGWRVLAVALALAVLLGWLLAPGRFGGGAGLAELLTPEPAKPAWPGLVATALWLVGTSLVLLAVTAIGDAFDLDAPTSGVAWRPATPGEAATAGARHLLLASFHALLCVGWPMREARGRTGTLFARGALLAIGLGGLVGTLAGVPAEGILAGIGLLAPATVVMAQVALLGGRVWPLIPANAFAWTVPMLAQGVPVYG